MQGHHRKKMKVIVHDDSVADTLPPFGEDDTLSDQSAGSTSDTVVHAPSGASGILHPQSATNVMPASVHPPGAEQVDDRGSQVCPLCGDVYSAGLQFCENDGHPLHPTLTMKAYLDARTESTVIDHRYLVRKTLAISRTALVFAAQHIYLKREVVLKVIRPEFLRDDIVRKRLKREGAMAAKLSHPHIVDVLDFGLHDGQVPFLVMERLYGETLADALSAKKPWSQAQVLELALQLSEALAFVHDQGLIHRDVKPSNVWISHSDDQQLRVKLLDFGICKTVSTHPQLEELTRPGAILGTPNYMAPEQCRGQATDERSDLYALGILLWSALMGYPPVQGRTHLEAMALHVARETPSPSSLGVEIAPALEAIIMRSLAKTPTARFSSAKYVYRALRAAQAVASK